MYGSGNRCPGDCPMFALAIVGFGGIIAWLLVVELEPRQGLYGGRG